ncbi:uncharacterized protein LOC114940329 [Nylanderia fulva]|uniref:uncharacterized protein LOC114940329 n=1 Tax=Nylanderia fulva TaxID=613905 RepID=UPI0010FB9895|nr:uncharacterized protein LOC114940329 [Nylanderia fulva]
MVVGTVADTVAVSEVVMEAVDLEIMAVDSVAVITDPAVTATVFRPVSVAVAMAEAVTVLAAALILIQVATAVAVAIVTAEAMVVVLPVTKKNKSDRVITNMLRKACIGNTYSLLY